jgi:hypothetical protein
MRDEDWMFREVEVLLAEPPERLAARESACVPADTTRYRRLRRLAEAVIAPALTATIGQLPAPQGQRGTVLA